MSYIVEFYTQFIKSCAGITPVWLFSNSNLIDTNDTQIEKNWGCFHGFIGISKEEFQLEIDKIKEENPAEEHWIKAGQWVNHHMLDQWFQSNMDRMATIEELVKLNGNLDCYIFYYHNNQITYDLQCSIGTTEEFDKWIVEVKTFMLKNNNIFPVVSFANETIRNNKKEKSVIFKCSIGLFDRYLAGYGIKPWLFCDWSRDISDAMIFNKTEANKLQSTLQCFLEEAEMIDIEDDKYNKDYTDKQEKGGKINATKN